MNRIRAVLLLAIALSLPAAAYADNGARDPWEGFNRQIFAFNEWFDRVAGTPIARGYQKATPEFADKAVTSFFRNLGDVSNLVDFALQGEGSKSMHSTARVLANTTLGLGGLVDIATKGGIPRYDTRFGTVLGKWGVESGPYLVLPFLGASTVRDAAGIPVDWTLNPLPDPLTVFDDDVVRLGLQGLMYVDLRADLLQYEQAIIGDRYVFLRDVYLQNRDYDVHGAPAKDPFLEDESAE